MNKKLTDYSVEELQAALEAKSKPKHPSVVLQNSSIANIRLINLAESYMNDEENGDEVETQYAYEALMEVVYGNNVFDYISNLHD